MRHSLLFYQSDILSIQSPNSEVYSSVQSLPIYYLRHDGKLFMVEEMIENNIENKSVIFYDRKLVEKNRVTKGDSSIHVIEYDENKFQILHEI